ncbi:hypothetical protein [Bradyrhizobium liaoningense]|uniref:hypothetical protein n=1 Tax=Bradyrhizobium liaoningense TaxID=43992 RepID=UPI001BADFBC1|nr:hypothetical protein [Bradyrhizobium liaoningense]MBR1068858.1 hypothetical protein [Bradyrhizobium liaoningense]
MPIVFVHGVNTRKTDPGYDAHLAMITKFIQVHFAGVSIGGVPLTTLIPTFPYWGDLATSFAWNMASLPSGEIDALGAAGVADDMRPLVGVMADGLKNPGDAKAQPLLTLARERSLTLAVEVVTDQLLRETPTADADRVADFIVVARRYAEAHPKPVWLAGLATDEQLLNVLMAELQKGAAPPGQVDALGGGFGPIFGPIAAAGAKIKQAVQNAADTVLDRTGNFASTKLLAWQRKPLNAILGRFFGDVFVYLDGRGDKAVPGAIPKLILSAFDQAKTATPGEPLVVVAHSLGGVIIFDLLGHFRPDLVVDLLITVGSQVSHFEEMKRFKASDPTVGPPKRAATPANVRRWINVFDEVDIFSYACDKVFDRVVDFRYDTQTYTIKAHGAYFEQDRFYSRLRARIDQLP